MRQWRYATSRNKWARVHGTNRNRSEWIQSGLASCAQSAQRGTGLLILTLAAVALRDGSQYYFETWGGCTRGGGLGQYGAIKRSQFTTTHPGDFLQWWEVLTPDSLKFDQ